jgi:hypothetical protein
MRILPALLFLLLTACKDQGKPFASPSSSDVSAIAVQLYNRQDGEAEIARFVIPGNSQKAILASLNGSHQDNNPMKWQVLGDIEITLKTGSINVDRFGTGQKLGAFRANGTYYRGSSDSEFIQLIKAAKQAHSEAVEATAPRLD